jgi:hypothetical protein
MIDSSEDYEFFENGNIWELEEEGWQMPKFISLHLPMLRDIGTLRAKNTKNTSFAQFDIEYSEILSSAQVHSGMF